jgi:hypothetical protein
MPLVCNYLLRTTIPWDATGLQLSPAHNHTMGCHWFATIPRAQPYHGMSLVCNHPPRTTIPWDATGLQPSPAHNHTMGCHWFATIPRAQPYHGMPLVCNHLLRSSTIFSSSFLFPLYPHLICLLSYLSFSFFATNPSYSLPFYLFLHLFLRCSYTALNFLYFNDFNLLDHNAYIFHCCFNSLWTLYNTVQ